MGHDLTFSDRRKSLTFIASETSHICRMVARDVRRRYFPKLLDNRKSSLRDLITILESCEYLVQDEVIYRLFEPKGVVFPSSETLKYSP
jgi:hypothetical protein